MDKKYYTPEQAAEILQVSAATVRSYLKSSRLKAYKIGGKRNNPRGQWRILPSDLDKFVEGG